MVVDVRICAFVSFLFWVSTTHADSWAAPGPIAAVSENAEWLVRVAPGESLGDTYGFAGEKIGKYAEAVLYQYNPDPGEYRESARFYMTNPISPVEVLVTNDGRLVSLDNWHNMGIGVIFSAYDPDGKSMVRLTLSDVFSKKQLVELVRTTSSIWWRCGDAKIDDLYDSVVVSDSLGREVSINYLTGAVRVTGESDRCIEDDT